MHTRPCNNGGVQPAYPYLRIRGGATELKLSPFSNGFLLPSSGPSLMPAVPRYAYAREDRHTDGRTKSGLNTIAPHYYMLSEPNK